MANGSVRNSKAAVGDLADRPTTRGPAEFPMSDRRENSRSKPAFRNGMLVGLGERHFVRIDDESAGGFSVAAQYLPGFPIGARVRLFVDDDQEISVIVRHLEPAGLHVRIGLERCEEPSDPADLRDAFVATTPAKSGSMPLVYAAAVGLALGCVFLVEPLRQRLQELWRELRFF